ncbi:unnamed protein product [Trichobilharzia regenti]|nr:unnamed protein product [Trichobilharzia regenti]
MYFESIPYKVDPDTGLIDYNRLEMLARAVRPKLIIAGTSAYSRHLDYARFQQIADSVSAVLFADMVNTLFDIIFLYIKRKMVLFLLFFF